MSAKVTTLLEGVPQLVRALRMTDEATRKHTVAAIERGTKRVTAGAKARVPKRSGELAYTIRDEYSKDGMVGYVKAGYGTLPRSRSSRGMGAKSRANALARREQRRLTTRLAPTSKKALATADLGIYGPVVEHGDRRRHKPAHPYMVPAFQAEKQSIVTDLGDGTKAAAKEGGLA
jgi:Bacteriophage protein of unknown function (DUF646).